MPDNWRETLFVWDGIISIVEKDKENGDGNDAEEADDDDGKDERLKWEGTWVGCDYADATKVPTPKRGAFDEFVSSENAFLVEGVAAKPNEKAPADDGGILGGNVSSLRLVSMTEGSGYDLGEGDEKKRHTDDRHDMYFFSPSLRWQGNLKDQVQNMVMAVGENEFGRFISVGWLRVGCRVTLARRYVDEGDDRAKWDIDDLRKAVFDQIATKGEDGTMTLTIPPWQCAAMHADPGQGAKRQKTAEE